MAFYFISFPYRWNWENLVINDKYRKRKSHRCQLVIANLTTVHQCRSLIRCLFSFCTLPFYCTLLLARGEVRKDLRCRAGIDCHRLTVDNGVVVKKVSMCPKIPFYVVWGIDRSDYYYWHHRNGKSILFYFAFRPSLPLATDLRTNVNHNKRAFRRQTFYSEICFCLQFIWKTKYSSVVV